MADIIDELRGIGFDVDGALPRFCDNREMYQKYLLKFPEEQYIPSYKKAFEVGSFDDAAEHIHEFKGVSGNLGATLLFQLSSDIMTLFRQGSYDAIPEMNVQLYEEFERISSEIIKVREAAGL